VSFESRERSVVDPPDSSRGVQPSVSPTETGLKVTDPIERQQELFWTAPPDPSLYSTSESAIPAPVSTNVAVPVDELGLDRLGVVIVRDAEWNMLGVVDENATETYSGEILVEISGPIKIYLRVDGTVTIHADEETWFEVEAGTDLQMATRSKHSRPARTVTSPRDPEGMMAAISTFGSALKTTSPERSWPTLRGHPPAIALGDELDVPAGLETPSTGIELVVPPDFEHLYPAAPLAYYLGLAVEPGPRPEIRIDGESEHRLPTYGSGYETALIRLLKKTLFLECCARTNGLSQLPIYERDRIEGDIDLELDRFYGRSPAERLRDVVSVPWSAIEPYVPDWALASYVAPEPRHSKLLPYLVDDLSIVRTRVSHSTVEPEPVDETKVEEMQSFLRSSGAVNASDEYISVHSEANDILEEVWVGDEIPVRASKTTPSAYENRFDREPTDPPIEVAVVLNDERMATELDAAAIYADEEDLPFEVSIYRELSVAALRTRLEHQPTDFLHYIGHADSSGLKCADGWLDLHELRSVELDAFLLNACQSYKQGMALIERGAIGGIVTLREVADSVAVDLGELLAGLLNAGYPLRGAVSVAYDQYLTGQEYKIVGDGGFAISQSSIAPLYTIDRVGEDRFEFQAMAYPSNTGVGGVGKCHLDHPEMGYYLIGNESPRVEVSREPLEELLARSQCPVLVDGDPTLRWSRNLDLE